MFRVDKLVADPPLAKTYRLVDEAADALVDVVPDRGGIVTRWAIGDREIFYLDHDRFNDPTLTVRGGNPILFPICGNLPDDRYALPGGETGTLNQHGFARNLPWSVVSSSTEGSASLTISLESSLETLAVYPFPFRLTFSYQLRGNELTIAQRYHNRGDRRLPFSVGFHPYFAVEDKSGLDLIIPSESYIDHKTGDHHDFSGTLDFNQPELDLAFPNLKAGVAQVRDRRRGTTLSLHYDEEFSALVFWTLADRPFYCLEPWTGLRNALNTGDRLIWLEPGESKALHTRLALTIQD